MGRVVESLLVCAKSARASFYSAGFELPKQYLAAIEGLRERRDGERDYQEYLDEKLREYALMPYPWQPSVRHFLRTDQRSAYLDSLATRSEANSASLDPNFNLFVRLSAEVWGEQLEGFRNQKQRELELHAAALRDLPRESSKALMDSIMQIAGRHGFVRQSKIARNERMELEHSTDEIRIRIMDISALRKRGNVIVQYVFHDLPDKAFGLDSFVPGGYLYSEWNKTPLSILFSFYVQCRFAADLAICMFT